MSESCTPQIPGVGPCASPPGVLKMDTLTERRLRTTVLCVFNFISQLSEPHGHQKQSLKCHAEQQIKDSGITVILATLSPIFKAIP